MATESELLNMISDLRATNDDIAELEERITKLKNELEGAEDDLVGAKQSAESDRERLDDLIAELTGEAEEKSMFDVRRAYDI